MEEASKQGPTHTKALSAELRRQGLSCGQLAASEGPQTGRDDQNCVGGRSLCLQCGSWIGRGGDQRLGGGLKR